MHSTKHIELLVARAHEIGFELVGVCQATAAATFPTFERWLDQKTHRGDNGFGMPYLERYRAARRHPSSVLPGVKSLIVVGLSYASVSAMSDTNGHDSRNTDHRCTTGNDTADYDTIGYGMVAEYACGLDYHDVVRDKLKLLAETHRALFPDAQTRIAVDTAPILEREYAFRSGLGWPGKNTMLINDDYGSRFFIGTLLSTVEIVGNIEPSLRGDDNRVNTGDVDTNSSNTVYSSRLEIPEAIHAKPSNTRRLRRGETMSPGRQVPAHTDSGITDGFGFLQNGVAQNHSHCGSCQKCVDACPTGALDEPYLLNAKKCLNYWSIEHQTDDVPVELQKKMGNRLFGCDTCQTVCPFNRPNGPTRQTGSCKTCQPHKIFRPTVEKPLESLPNTSMGEVQQMTLREQLFFGQISLDQIESLDEKNFREMSVGTPLQRLGLTRLKRNAAIVKNNQQPKR